MAEANPEPERTLLPTVQLLHELPDGTGHIDWLLAQDSQGLQPLISFRLQKPLHEFAEGESAAAVRIADHRPVYLDYEGRISGNRGSVSRVGRGSIHFWDRSDDRLWELEIKWESAGKKRGSCQRLGLQRQDLDRWTVFLRPQTGPLR